MAKIKEKDFIEVNFTGRIKETNDVFDTTVAKIAKDNGLTDKSEYKPAVICVGEGHLFKKIEDKIIGKEAGRSYKVELSPEESFGKKDAKLFRMIPVSVFKKNKMNPVPGLTLEVDGMMGVVRTVGGGRCMVDFNHPLSGKDVVYTLKVNKIVKDVVDKVKAIIEMDLRIKEFKVEQKEKNIDVVFDEKVSKHLTDEMKKTVEKRVKDLVGVKINIK